MMFEISKYVTVFTQMRSQGKHCGGQYIATPSGDYFPVSYVFIDTNKEGKGYILDC